MTADGGFLPDARNPGTAPDTRRNLIDLLQGVTGSVGSGLKHRIHESSGHDLRITAILPVPGTRDFLTSSFDGTVRQWDEETGSCRKVYRGSGRKVFSLAWLGNDRFAAGSIEEIDVWKLGVDEPHISCILNHEDSVLGPGIRGLAPLDDSRRLAWISHTGEVGILDLESGDPRIRRQTANGNGKCLAVFPEAGMILGGFEDGSLLSWDEDLGEPAVLFRNRDIAVNAISIIPEHGKIVIGMSDGSVHILAPDGQLESTFRSSHSGVRSLWPKPGKPGELVVTRRFGRIEEVDWTTGTVLRNHISSKKSFAEFLWDDERHICFCGQDCVAVADLENQRITKEFGSLPPDESGFQSISSMALSPDRSLLAFARFDGRLGIVDYRTGELLATTNPWEGEEFEEDPSITVMAFSHDSRYLMGVSRTMGGPVFTFDTRTLEVVTTFSGWVGQLFTVAPTQTPEMFIIAGRSGESMTRVTVGGRVLRQYVGHTDSISGIATSPDGRTMASCSADRTIRIWDVGTALNIKTIELSGYWGQNVAYSRDGAYIAYCDSEGEVLLLETEGYTKVYRSYESMRLPKWAVPSPDGSRLAVGYQWEGIDVIDLADREIVSRLHGGTTEHYCASFNGMGDRILAGYFNMVEARELADNLGPGAYYGRTHVADSYISLEEKSHVLCLGCYRNSASVLNLETLEIRANITQTGNTTDLVAGAPDPGRIFYSSVGDRDIYSRRVSDGGFDYYLSMKKPLLQMEYDVSDSKLLYLTEGNIFGIYDGMDHEQREYPINHLDDDIISFRRRKDPVFTLLLGKSGKLYEWEQSFDCDRNTEIRLPVPDFEIAGFACSDDERELLVWNADSRILVLEGDLHELRMKSVCDASAPVRCVLPALNGGPLIIGLQDGRLETFDENGNGRILAAGHRPGTRVNNLIRYPGAGLVICSGQDGILLFLDDRTLEERGSFRLYRDGFLWTTVPDDIAPNGWFWTEKTESVDVMHHGDDGRQPASSNERKRYMALYNNKEKVRSAIFRRSEHERMLLDFRENVVGDGGADSPTKLLGSG